MLRYAINIFIFKIKKSSGKAIINVFINSSLSICKNFVLVLHKFHIRNCTNLDNVRTGSNYPSHFLRCIQHVILNDHLKTKLYLMWLYCHVRKESIIGNKVIRFILVLLFLFFIALVFLSYYIDLFWVFMSKKCFLSFYSQFPEFSKNKKIINLNVTKCNCRPQMQQITMSKHKINSLHV